MQRLGCVLLAAGLMVCEVGPASVGLAAEPAALTPEQAQINTDAKYAMVYIRDYQKAPDRVWMYPVQLAGMMKHGPDVIAWVDRCEKRWTATQEADPEGFEVQRKMRGLTYQVRAHTLNYLSMKEKIAAELPGKLEAQIKEADAQTAKGADSGAAGDFDKGRKALEKAEEILVMASVVYKPEDAELAKAGDDVKALKGRIEERQKAYWEKSKEKAKKPQEGYRSSDLEKIRAVVLEAWKAKYPDDTGVTVVVPSNTNMRVTVASFNEKEKTLELEDISRLPVRVLVDAESGMQWVYSAVLIKTGATASPTYAAEVSKRDALTSPRDLVKK